VATVVGILLVLLAVVALVSLVLGVRERLPLRIALRNVRRGRWRTVLVVLGLLVATTIVSGSLVIGDTVDAVSVYFTYEALGHIDEGVYNSSPTLGDEPFPYSVFVALNASVAGDGQIAGIVPEIVSTVQVLDLATHVPQTGLNLVGANANQSSALGAFTSDAGASLAGPSTGQVFLDDQAASDLNASVGDTVRLYGPASVTATVGAIVHDDQRGGFLDGGNVFAPLAMAQTLENETGSVNFLAVANVGTVTSAVGLSASVSATLNDTLATFHPNYGLASYSLLASALASAESAGSSLTTLFLVVGLFSILAGSMLIVGIFVMLAEERKGEMGMLRAIGLRRRQLVYTYYFEGLVYSAGSAGVGTALGVGVGYGLTYAFALLFSAGAVTSSAILGSFTVSGSSLLTAYVVGFLLTLATVIVTTRWTANLNIVRAIRSVPEPPPTHRTYTLLAIVGVVLAVLGAGILDATARGSGDISVPVIGGALVLLGAGFILARFVKDRYAFTASAIALLVWGGIGQFRDRILGGNHSGSIFALFVIGILLVGGAILLYVFNSNLLVGALDRLAGQRARTVSVVRVGLSYPGRRAFRTAINLTIFSLVLFTIVAVASFGSSVQSDLSADIQSQSGGYTLFGYSAQPISDLPGQIANNSSLAPLFSNVVPFVSGGVLLNYSGAGTAFPYGVFAAPTDTPPSSDFYTTNQYNFSATWHGMSTAQVFDQLATNDSVAIVDGGFSSKSVNLGSGPTMAPLAPGASLELLNPDNGVHRNVTVIGILGETFISGVFVDPTVAQTLGFGGDSAFLLTVAPGQSATHAAQLTKSAFFPYGLILFDFAQILQKSIQDTEAVIGLLEIFVALGLAVGIAAMGIVALRAVAERRSEIGMLRAEGFTRGMVVATFLLEYSYVALLGIGIGTSLAILLIYNASQSESAILAFAIPWWNIAIVVSVAYGLTVLATLGPSLKAARLPPAEAVRYSE
jgi:putative ABC transport system permease protein